MIIDCVKSKLKENLKNKTFILQFLPKALFKYQIEPHFNHKEKKLKSAYLIDIVHTLILKFYFKRENRFNLSSLILKSRYGQYYNYYMSFLVDIGILQIVKKHQKGQNARIYSLSEDIIRDEIRRFKNEDPVILKRYVDSVIRIESHDFESNLIDVDVKRKLIEDLTSVTILFDNAKSLLEQNINEISIFNRNMYSVECINLNHIFYHFDDFGRVHTNFTILKSCIRKKCLLIDGEETSEIDIKNSQPFFLCKLIESQTDFQINLEEYNLYKSLVLEGKLYEHIMSLSNRSREETKDLVYKVLFGKNLYKCKSTIIFKKLFPNITDFIKYYKKSNGGYKVLSHRLQNLESDVIFNNIVKEIMYIYPEIKLITVHDSIICQKKHFNIVNSIFQKNIKNILL